MDRAAEEFRDVLALALKLRDPAPVEAFLAASMPFQPSTRFDATAAWAELPAEVRERMLTGRT